MLTGMEKRMYDAEKHRAEIITNEGDIFIGLCTVFTSAYDNDPGEATLTMKELEKNGKPFIGEFVEFEVSEIRKITILDKGD